MLSEYNDARSVPSSPICDFSRPAALAHCSVETPLTPPFAAYSTEIESHPANPLLALQRSSLEEHIMASTDASKLLRLQTDAAHRPAAKPLQHSSSTSSSSSSHSSSSTASPATLCCCRCRRESGSGMIQFATNLYYCNHCARMTGYCAG